jgi:hypothetical protein
MVTASEVDEVDTVHEAKCPPRTRRHCGFARYGKERENGVHAGIVAAPADVGKSGMLENK